MPLPLLPLLVIGGAAAYVISERSTSVKRRKEVSKKKLIDAAESLRNEVEIRRRRAEDSRWRVLKREPWVLFRSTDAGQSHTKVGNQIVVRVGTKDRTSSKNESGMLLYPISSSDHISYNYYRVIFTAENEYDLDRFGNPIQKQVELEKVYDELPGPKRIMFFAYEHSKASDSFAEPDDYLCASCSYRDAALIEFSDSGKVVGLATAEPSPDSAEILKARFPRPGDLNKAQRLKRIWVKLSSSQLKTVRDVLGKNRSDKLEKLILKESSDYAIMEAAEETVRAYEKLPVLEQGRLVLRARSSLGQDNITQIVEILTD